MRANGGSLRFAVSGVHGSGKTTLCHKVAAQLREEGINVAVAPESARQSLYLAARTILPEMEIEILGLQIAEEMRASATASVVLCDRCVLDTFAYCLARFPKPDTSSRAIMVEAINDFGRRYVGSYESVFYLPHRIISGPTGDAFRDTDPVGDGTVGLAFEKAITAWKAGVIRLERTSAFETMVRSIKAAAAHQ